MTALKRWYAHVTASNNKDTKHRPLACAIRKYGAKNMKLEVIDQGIDREAIEYAEKWYIELFNTIAPNGYNVTPGGETGSNRALWDRLDKDPVERAAYLKRLSEGCRNGRHMQRTHILAAAGIKWRKDNPEIWREITKRAGKKRSAQIHADPIRGPILRANKERQAKMVPRIPENKEYHSEIARKQALVQWANYTDEQRQEVLTKISKKHKANNSALTLAQKAIKDTQLAKARESLDREKWKKAIHIGRAAYWARKKAEKAEQQK